jgi:hypothetical protein
MGFFAEIKSRLGLDIAPFERGLANAQKHGGRFAESFGKKLGGVQQAGGALAVALGMNFQNIAEGIASVVNGGTKEAWENALKSAQEYDKQLEKIFLKTRTSAQQADYWKMEKASFEREANAARKQIGEGEGILNTALRMLPGVKMANRAGWFGAESEAGATTRKNNKLAQASQAGEFAKEAEANQKKLEQALADELETRRLIGKEEGEQVLSLRKRADALMAESEVLKKTDAAGSAAKRLEAERLYTEEKRMLVGIEKNHLKTREQLDEMEREMAARMETEVEKINRLRSEALTLQVRSLDNSRSIDQKNADILNSQKKINQALDAELALRKSNLSTADIAAKGGSSTRGREAQKAQRLRGEADAAAARGNFALAEKRRNEAQGIDDKLAKQERDYLEGKGDAAQSEWDMRNGAKLKQRGADMDAGLALARARAESGKSLTDQIMAGAEAAKPKASVTREFSDALDKAKVLQEIRKLLEPQATE